MSPVGLLGFEGAESLISGANRSISATLAAKARLHASTGNLSSAIRQTLGLTDCRTAQLRRTGELPNCSHW